MSTIALPHAPTLPTGYGEAMQFLLGRIDYERTSAAPSPVRDFRLDRRHE